MNNYLTFALPKGRLGDNAIQQLAAIGLASSIEKDSRKLVFTDQKNNLRFMFVKPVDVITYVENGVADVGIIGKDSILEEAADVYELLDLGFGKCKFAIAGQIDNRLHQTDTVLKIATKYPRVTMEYFAKRNQPIEIIRLNGSVELAPLVGLSDVIVDIVETGGTLQANGLVILEDMMEISAKLIANRVSYRFKFDRIHRLVEQFQSIKEVTK
jgi:ATP phosphoribosyltransferase